MSDLIVYLFALKAGSVAVGTGADLRADLDSEPPEEFVRYGSIQESAVEFSNKVEVYRMDEEHGEFYILRGSGETGDFYSRIGQFPWKGCKPDKMTVSDFNDDGFREVLYYCSDSESAVMLQYDRASDKFKLVPVMVEIPEGEYYDNCQ